MGGGGFLAVRQSALSLCRRLLDFPFCILLFRKVVLPPSSAPSDVMTRSLNLCLGSGGSVSDGVPTLSSTSGSCRSTLALERRTLLAVFVLLLRYNLCILSDTH